MKKSICILLLVILTMGVVVTSASAGGDHTNWAYGFTAYTDGSTLNHNPNRFHPKTGTENFIEVRHAVTGNGSSAGHTNYIYAKILNGNYVGAKWQAPNMIYYTCTSSSLQKGINVTPGGRANTKYKEQQGLNFIMIEGQFRTH